MHLLKQLDHIELKIRQLGQKVERLQRENESLRADNLELKTELDRQRGVVGSLKDKLERTQQELERRDSVQSGPPADDLREQIDHYLREIDRCIEWLEQQ